MHAHIVHAVLAELTKDLREHSLTISAQCLMPNSCCSMQGYSIQGHSIQGYGIQGYTEHASIQPRQVPLMLTLWHYCSS